MVALLLLAPHACMDKSCLSHCFYMAIGAYLASVSVWHVWPVQLHRWHSSRVRKPGISDTTQMGCCRTLWILLRDANSSIGSTATSALTEYMLWLAAREQQLPADMATKAAQALQKTHRQFLACEERHLAIINCLLCLLAVVSEEDVSTK